MAEGVALVGVSMFLVDDAGVFGIDDRPDVMGRVIDLGELLVLCFFRLPFVESLLCLHLDHLPPLPY